MEICRPPATVILQLISNDGSCLAEIYQPRTTAKLELSLALQDINIQSLLDRPVFSSFFFSHFTLLDVGWYGAVVKAPCPEACTRSGELCRLCVRNSQLTQFS